MHSNVVQAGTVCKFNVSSGLAVVLLLVHDVVLSTSNNTSVLNALDSLCNGNSSQNWVGTEA
jgi:hypothetical protein